MDLPTGLDAGLGEGVQKPLTIRVVTENEFATVPVVQDVVNRTGILNAKFAGHAGPIKPQGRKVSRLGTATSDSFGTPDSDTIQFHNPEFALRRLLL